MHKWPSRGRHNFIYEFILLQAYIQLKIIFMRKLMLIIFLLSLFLHQNINSIKSADFFVFGGILFLNWAGKFAETWQQYPSPKLS